MLPPDRQSALDADEPPEPSRPATVGSADRQKKRSPQLQALHEQLSILSLALRHPQTPWYAKALVFATLAYAASPLDLIPDFIPLFGLLDDMLIAPAGVWLAEPETNRRVAKRQDDMLIAPAGVWLAGKLVPTHILRLCRVRAALAEGAVHYPSALWGQVMVVGTWMLLAAIGLGLIVWR